MVCCVYCDCLSHWDLGSQSNVGNSKLFPVLGLIISPVHKMEEYQTKWLVIGAVGLGIGVSFVFIRRYFAGGVCRSKAMMTGKTVVITGANTGIGKETALDLAKRKAKVILACRDPEKGKKAASDIIKKSGNPNVVFRRLDIASFDSIRTFAIELLSEEPAIDVLINNAGVMQCPYWKTADGNEMQFGVNHLGHFLLTNLLLERLMQAPAARIVVVSSRFYERINSIKFDDINSEKSYDPSEAYAQSKLANILFTRALAKRLEGTSVIVNCLHPGVVRTELGRHMMKNVGFLKMVS